MEPITSEAVDAIVAQAKRIVASGKRVNISRLTAAHLGVQLHGQSPAYKIVQDALVKEGLTFRHKETSRRRKHYALPVTSSVKLAPRASDFARETIARMNAGEERGLRPESTCDELDDFLAAEAEKGNQRALRLLKQRISGK